MNNPYDCSRITDNQYDWLIRNGFRPTRRLGKLEASEIIGAEIRRQRAASAYDASQRRVSLLKRVYRGNGLR